MEKPNPKARRIHTKSRTGCLECKRRHIRCDEKTPVCDRCAFSSRQCEYASLPSRKSTPRPDGSSTGPGSVPTGQEPDPFLRETSTQHHHSLNSTVASPSFSSTGINLAHLELLHHFEAETCKTVAISEEGMAVYHRVVISRGLCNIHLMNQILALSALHLSLQRSNRREYYQSLASDMQSTALVGFHELLANVDEANCVDVLLFSHLIALHVFCDTFNALKDDFSEFLDRFVGCVKLLGGVQIVIHKWWTELDQTEIGILMRGAEKRHKANKSSKGECRELQAMIQNADLSDASIRTCNETLERLQGYLDVENLLEQPSGSSEMIFAWLVTLTPDFTELLDQRKPEALVILAYYAVLLHKRRDSWVIGDAGGRLFRRVSQYLGSRWQHWLTWPLSVLGSSSNVNTPVEMLARSETSHTMTPS